MPESPVVESPNILTIDTAGNGDAAEIFAHQEVGQKGRIEIEYEVVGKYPEGVKLAVEKLIWRGSQDVSSKDEARADAEQPIMMRMRRRSRNRGMMGPHNRPPQTAVNSQEPWQTAFV